TDNVPTNFEITGTIMRLQLPKPLAPGASIRIAVPFREQIPRQTRRGGWMSREGVEYSMSQWYPKIAEYDEEGWHRQEYIAREFYGVWGDFNVEITLPSRFTIGASGECINPMEVAHGYDRIASGEKQGLSLPENAPGMTTWKFHASPVHDFAWVADDKYIHEWTTWQQDTGNGNTTPVTLHAFYLSLYAGIWHDALKYTQFVLSTYSQLYGPYAYRNFSTTMAGDGGMEYPQLVMITGYRPSPLSLAGVIAHEVAHQWFYGMLGSNETRQAFMDEGFTTYATTVSMNKLFGDHQIPPGTSRSWLDWFLPLFSNKSDNYRGYQSLANARYEEPLDIPHDWFREDATANQVYGKTQAILSMLQYTLGDSVFAHGMKAYYWKWRFKHPHLVDFKKVMEDVSHTDLDWFFDEWFETTRTVDYEAVGVSSKPASGSYETTVHLRNNNLAVMPIDLLLHYDDGSSQPATIPIVTNKNNPYHKPEGELFFPGWDWVSPEYIGTVATPKRVSWYEIDTSFRLQDLNWLNNYSPRGGLWQPRGEWVLWKQLFLDPPIDRYYSVTRPIVWYEAASKLNVGLGTKYGMNNSFSGDVKVIYKTDPIRIEAGESVNPKWYDYLDGALTYSTPIDWIGRLGTLNFDANKMDGIGTARASLTKIFRPEYYYLGATHSVTFYFETQQQLNADYPYYHTGWSSGVTDVVGLHYTIVSQDHRDHFDLSGESSVGNSDASFALAKAKYEYNFSIIEDVSGKLRLTAGAGTNGVPYERRFWLDRANNYEEQSDGFFRAISQLSPTIGPKASMFAEGGAGVRGYNANAPAADSVLSGTAMLGGSFDVSVPNPFASLGSFASSFAPGIFMDAGWVGAGVMDLTRDIQAGLRTDAGIAFNVNILSWLPGQLRGVANEYTPVPEVNVYFPLFENHPLDGKSPFAFRWALSLGAAF
ncbi:MAG TPA: M1 family aminopeptidase, partial [Candidatus Kapabacteria bacterium]|nr:M1 family aminopeptidase [Candidatus Kapabacteria bacterium]